VCPWCLIYFIDCLLVHSLIYMQSLICTPVTEATIFFMHVYPGLETMDCCAPFWVC
jgi:hypothetical protein